MNHKSKEENQFNEFYVVSQYQSQGIKIPSDKRNNISGSYELKCADDVVFKPFGQEPVLIHTGLKASMPESNVLMVYDHHLNAIDHHIMMMPAILTFNNEYFENGGEICAYFQNYANYPVTLHKGDKIMEAVFVKTFDTNSRDVWREF